MLGAYVFTLSLLYSGYGLAAILMALGGILALMDRRYRITNKKAAKEAQEAFEA